MPMPTVRRSNAFYCLLPLLCACGSSGPVDGAAAFRHVEKLVAIGPRPFGSEALGKAADYLSAEIGKLGLTMQRHEVMDDTEKKLIRNLWTQIDGPDPNGPILMLGAHYDTKLTHGHGEAAHNFEFVGAIDGGGAPAVLVELARVIKERKPKVNVWLYWIDAEESIEFDWKPERALIGSKAFCKHLNDTKVLPRVKAFVLLDLIGDKNIKIDRDLKSDKELQDLFAAASKRMGEDKRVYQMTSGTTDDHETFLNYGVRSVLLIDFIHRVPPHLQKLRPGDQPVTHPDYEQWWHTPGDTPDKMSPASLAFAGNLVMEAFDDLEQFVSKR